MATTNKRVLRLSFTTSTGETMSFTLPDPKFSVTQVEIVQAMDLVISKGIFGGEKGSRLRRGEKRVLPLLIDYR